VRWYVARNDCASTDKSVSANGDTANDGGVCAYGCSALDQRPSEFVFSADIRTRIENVGKNATWTAEHILFKFYTLVEGHIILDLAAVANAYIGADHYILAENNVPTNSAPRQHVYEMPDFTAFADLNVGIDIRTLVDVHGSKLELKCLDNIGVSRGQSGMQASLSH
jgi:hypothetical protein